MTTATAMTGKQWPAWSAGLRPKIGRLLTGTGHLRGNHAAWLTAPHAPSLPHTHT